MTSQNQIKKIKSLHLSCITPKRRLKFFQSNNITRTRTWRKKLFESFKAKEESSPPHAIHFEALTHTTYKNNNNCTSSSKHTQRKIARKKEQRPKSRGDRNKKERKERKLINIRTLTS